MIITYMFVEFNFNRDFFLTSQISDIHGKRNIGQWQILIGKSNPYLVLHLFMYSLPQPTIMHHLTLSK